ncbi:MAG TPA: response regulator transcription factor [Dehalococcoidia bacterium]|nr:response regulator transcription factor [Dehalococcoidia bacterium]
MTSNSRSTILVIDDDAKIVSLLRRALSYEGYSVHTALTATEGLSSARDEPPDLVVLDLMLPDMDGYEVCRRLRAAGDTPVLMLTARDEIEDRVRGLDEGADDYLVKPFALQELLARVRVLLRRVQNNAEPRQYKFEDLVLDTATREASRGDRQIALSTKEYQLLSLFMRHPRQVLTRDVIMDQVWGYDYSGESNVLEVYVGYLRQKLEACGEPRLIHTMRGAGYVLKAPAAEKAR